MPSREKHNAYRRAWWRRSLGDRLTESRVFLPMDAHDWAVKFASQVEERIPLILGRLVVAQITELDENFASRSPDKVKIDVNVPQEQVAINDLYILFRAILTSRFPEDTGSTRLRQVGFVAAIASAVEAGEKPTASAIASSTNNQVSQITILAKAMYERGVIDIRQAPSVSNGKAAKIFSIRRDAVAALNSSFLKADIKVNDELT